MKQNCAKKQKKKTVEIALRYSEDTLQGIFLEDFYDIYLIHIQFL